MQNDPQIITKQIPLNQIQPDRKQPRKELRVDDEENRLFVSIKKGGLRQALAVVKNGEDKYKIIDGHRRYACAVKLGWKTIRCDIHPDTDEGDQKWVRFNLQNNIRPWKPLERAKEVKEIKDEKQFKSNRELADYLQYSENLLGLSLKLQKLREEYQELMDQHGLSNSFQMEFVRLQPKIRPVKELTIDKIVHSILERIEHEVIGSAKELRILGRIFLRAHANEEALYRYLKDPDMAVEDLDRRTVQSGFAWHVEQIIEEIASRRSKGIAIPTDKKALLTPLRDLLDDSL